MSKFTPDMSDDLDFEDEFNRLIEPLYQSDEPRREPFSILFERRIDELGITQSRAEAM